MTPKNKYNFELISPNSNGSIILNIINKTEIVYQLLTCKGGEIKFKIENSNRYFRNKEYPLEKTINKDGQIKLSLFLRNEILVHSFNSNDEFLFLYSFKDYSYYRHPFQDFSLISIIEISNNILQIQFFPEYIYCLSQYYIIVAKKNNNYNIESLSERCYLSQLLLQNITDSIIFKLVYPESDMDIIIANIDISELNAKENSELVATVMNYNSFNISKPIEFKLQKHNFIEFKIGEEVTFNLKDQNFFKLEYKHESDSPQDIYFYFKTRYDFYVFLSNNEKTTVFKFDESEGELMKINLTKSDTYYIEFYSQYNYAIFDNHFISFFPGTLIDTIDLTQNIYYGNSIIKTKTIVEPNKYKVKNLKNDTLVHFIYNIVDEEEDEEYDPNKFYNPFEICNDNNNNCTKNVNFFTFFKGNEYTIYIHFTEKIERKWYDRFDFYYYPYYK